MANTAAENLAGKDKVEKRRALGRGLESLLPGPRVVSSPAGDVARGQNSGAVSQQIPDSVRNDKHLSDKPVPDAGEGVAVPGLVIRAVVEDAGEEDAAEAEVRSAGPPGAAVPTQTGAPAREESVGRSGAQEGITIFAQAETRIPGNLVVNIELDAIDKNPYQTRYDFDEEKLEELAESIRVQGVVQPVLVRPAEEEGRYILILGERRCRASKMAGKTLVPAMVKRVSEQQAAEMTIIENLQREDLNCIEQAEGFRVLSKEFSLTQAQIGQRVGMSRESVSNYMRLLKLPKETMEHVIAGRISFSEARELVKLEDPAAIMGASRRAVKEQMRFEQVEAMVMRMLGLLDPMPGDLVLGAAGPAKKSSGARWVDPNVKAAQTDLERMLGVRVRIRDRKGKGKIVIEYHTVDDYDRVVEMLRGKGN